MATEIRYSCATAETKKMKSPAISLLIPWISEVYSVDEWVVAVAHEPVVHRQVPKPPVLSKLLAVPPLLVELSISKEGEFCQDVEQVLKTREEHDDPGHTVGKSQAQHLWSHGTVYHVHLGQQRLTLEGSN